MTQSDQLKAVIMVAVVVLSVVAASGLAGAEVSPDDSDPVDIIAIDDNSDPNPNTNGPINASNNSRPLAEVQSASGPPGTNASVITVSINTTINGTNSIDPVAITLTDGDSSDPLSAGNSFGVNNSESVTVADGDQPDDLSGGSTDGNLTVRLEVDASTGSFTDGDELALVVDSDGDGDFTTGRTEAIDPAVVVNNRDVDPAIQIGGPINNDSDPDIVDANNPRPDLNRTSQNDNDADGLVGNDSQTAAHSREQVKILSNITRDGSPQIADVVANISELSINTSRDNQTVPMHLDVDNNGRIDDSERGQDGANGTYIGRFYLNDTDNVAPSPRVNVTVTDTVGGVNNSTSGGNFTPLGFAGLGVGDSVVTGEDPENDQISGNRTTEPNRTQSPTNESINYYVYGQEGDNKVTVVFETELQGDNSTAVSGFFSDDDATNGLSRDDFSYIDNDAEGATSIQSVQHQPGSHVAVLTLDDDLSQDDVVGTSPLSDEIRVPANEMYISVGALSPSAGGDVFPLVTNRTQSLETDQSIFPTNITNVTTQTKDPTVSGRDVNPEEQITVNATFSVHPYGQNDSLNDTQVAVSLRGTDTRERTLLKQSFEDGLVDGAEFSDETIRLDDESIVIGRGDRNGSDPDGSVVTTLNLDALPPGGASAGNLTVEAQAYGLFDSDTIDNPSNATDRSITVDSVRPVVIGATTQPGGSGTNNVNGQNFDSNRVIELTFSEPILGNDANDPDRSDFEYNNNNNGNATEIVRVGRASGTNDRLFLAMDARVTTEDIDEDSIEVVPNQIVDAGFDDNFGPFEIGNTARGGLKEVNRSAIPLNITQAQDDPGVSVFPGAVKGDDAVLVTTESNLGLSEGNDVLIQLEDANGNNLVNQTTGNREAVRITDNGPNDLDSEDGAVATRILLTDIAGGEAQAGDLTAIAEASITDTDTNQIDDLDNADAESDPITIDNDRPTVDGNVAPVDSNELEVNFDEPVFARELSRERLTTDEIDYDDNNQGGATEIVSVDHTPGETSAILTMNADVTTQGSSADVNDDEVTFDVDQVEDKAGNSLIPGSESVPLGERRVDDLNVDTTASGEIAVEAIDDGSPKTGVAVTFAVTSGDGSFSNGEQLIEKETITQNNVPQAIATLSGNGTVEVSAGGLTETIDEFAVEDEPPTATVRFDDQTVENGSSSVNVASATFDGSEDFVIVVHQSSPGENGVVDDTSEINGKIGSSDVLTSNTVSNVPVDLTKELDENLTQLSENQSLIAMLHFANDSGGTNFGSPIVRDGSPVFDQANITVQEQVADPEPPENPVVGDSQAPAADINGDGKLEDVNGDGEVTFDDAVTLAFNTGDVSGNDSFDFDGDGDVDFDDAIALAFE